MKFENVDVYNIKNAIRGMRNPLNSWGKSDSWVVNGEYKIGEKDLGLAQHLILSGPEHAKFLRQIMISVDITAPLYLWKELDTYKVGTTANSMSTMHKLASTPITPSCIETDDLSNLPLYNDLMTTKKYWENFLEDLEQLRLMYVNTKDVRYWKELVRLLPNGWLQTRTWTANYAVLRNIYNQRKNHKLTEWHTFCDWIKTLPYAQELIIFNLDH